MSEPIQLQYATPNPGIPGALKVVAWLFIIGGVLTILQILIDLAHSKLTLNTGVLGVFVGPGLLRFRKGWRTCALVLLWIGMILTPLFFVVMVASNGPININFFGVTLGDGPMFFGVIFAALSFAVVVWEYRVLTREDIRQRFGLPPNP